MQPSWLLALSFEPNAVANNNKILDAEAARVDAEKRLVFSMRQVNRAMCTHANKTSYSFPEDSGWNCSTCGAAG